MRRTLRTVAIVSTAVLGGAIASVPANAWDVIGDTGTTGAYEIVDDQPDSWGANCVYETGSKDLDKISIRGPQNVHGASVSRRWIGYRYIIQRNSPPTGDLVYSTIYRSPILYAKADDNENPKSWSRRSSGPPPSRPPATTASGWPCCGTRSPPMRRPH